MHNDDTSIAAASKSDHGTLARSDDLQAQYLCFFMLRRGE